MKNRTIISVLLCLFAFTTAWAGPIGKSQAQQIAARFMAGHSMQTANMRMARKAPLASATAGSEQAAYYVFNASEGGYVVVAGDDRAPAVLGYSDTGSFSDEDVPEAMQLMLEGYAAQIAALEEGAQAAPQLTSGSAIAPLIKTQWEQDNPYNILLPILTAGSETGHHAAVGCVATALAQVMNYWRWPARPTQPLPAYTSQSSTANNEPLKFDMPELPVADFNWDAMADTYPKNDTTSEAAQAVAMLNLYCAQALKMTFKEASSGTVTTRIPMYAAMYFDYDAGARALYRGSYGTQEWADIIYGELAAGRPVVYSGSKKKGGHSFICDGYDGNGRFHLTSSLIFN